MGSALTKKMEKLKSSVPGMPYPTARRSTLRTAFSFLEGRRRDDGAEGLWRIQDDLYDLEKFIKNHPGGAEWLEITRGTDITEAFEAHHVTEKAERLLPKFFVRKASAPRSLPYTFDPKGFYRKFKERAREALKGVDFHNPSARSKLIADFLFVMTVSTALASAHYKSWAAAGASAVFLAWTAVVAHNFFHLRDNFRMYYFDMSVMSSKEWRISHALSHHLYPNTLWDMEIYMFEPFLEYLPRYDKSLFYRFMMVLTSPLVLSVTGIAQGIKRYYSLITEWKKLEFRDLVPFFLPLVMSFTASSFSDALKLWLAILVSSNFIFISIGLNAAHHHPEIFHDGDICRDELDWGLMEMDAVRDRKVIDDSLFLVLTNFGSHGLHHLLPTVDHAHLELCLPAFHETCREFGVHCDQLSQWELIKGQFRQLARVEPKRNYRGGPDSSARSV